MRRTGLSAGFKALGRASYPSGSQSQYFKRRGGKFLELGIRGLRGFRGLRAFFFIGLPNTHLLQYDGVNEELMVIGIYLLYKNVQMIMLACCDEE